MSEDGKPVFANLKVEVACEGEGFYWTVRAATIDGKLDAEYVELVSANISDGEEAVFLLSMLELAQIEGLIRDYRIARYFDPENP